MKEYIERGKFLKECMMTFGSMGVTIKVIEGIANECTADMVEVVRCKECRFYEANSCFNRQWDLESSTEIPTVGENDFCSYGERREQE